MPFPKVLSLIFYFAFMIYVYFGCFILNNDDNKKRKSVFFCLCMSLSIWSFSFSVANSAADYEMALFWRRVAALGWSMMYCLLLHFFMIITEQKKWLIKKWIIPLIYLPGVISCFAFSVYTPLALELYHLESTISGWVNVSVNSGWDWFFDFYYLSYTLISIGLIVSWGITGGVNEKKTARLLISSIIITLIVGTITDILFNPYLMGSAPQMAVIMILIPIGAIFYSMRHYEFMQPQNVAAGTQEGEILNDLSRKTIYKYLIYIYLIGSSLNFAAGYLIYQGDFTQIVWESLFFAGMGSGIMIISHLRIQDQKKDLIIAMMMAMTIPVVAVQNIAFAGITVWVAPVIFVILLIPFRNRTYLYMIGASSIITLIMIWIKNPLVIVDVSAADHFTRIVLFVIFLLLASYVNRIFVHRLEENEEKVNFQQMISQISTDFITTNELNFDSKVANLLASCGEHFKADRAYMGILSDDMETIHYCHVWCGEGVKYLETNNLVIQTDSIPWWMDQLMSSRTICIHNLDTIPEEAKFERELLINNNVQAVISLPLISNGQLLGLLGFDMVKNKHVWMVEYLELVKVISNILADALIKVRAEKEINHLAFYDSLTGLPNRILFKERLSQEISLASRTTRFIAVLFLDLDAFKSVNDSVGHEAGDELLKLIAKRLSYHVRKHDTVCRFGGDEYLIMLTNIDEPESIHPTVEHIMSAFEKPAMIAGQEFFITASAGIALYPVDGEEPDTLIKNADLAMYTSKDQGKNKYTLCSPCLKEDILKKMKLTNGLFRALERDELVLYYQPQICLETRQICGLEALIRWNHPEMGVISPGKFIPLAEQHVGLIVPIGDWVIKTACKQQVAWQKMGIAPLRMAVNLSAEQFRNPHLVKSVKRIIQETGISPEYLELEITESVALKGAFNVDFILKELKDLGVAIAIDDFGIEYSSLNRLKMLPIDRIKMDIEFVHGLTKNIKDEAIAKVIIQLAKNLDLKVIAEGVETASQLAFLAKEVCDEVQGFYYFKPMPADEVEKILKQYQERKITQNLVDTKKIANQFEKQIVIDEL